MRSKTAKTVEYVTKYQALWLRDAREIEITISSGISTGNNIQKEKNKLNAKLTVVSILHAYIYKMRHTYME